MHGHGKVAVANSNIHCIWHKSKSISSVALATHIGIAITDKLVPVASDDRAG